MTEQHVGQPVVSWSVLILSCWAASAFDYSHIGSPDKIEVSIIYGLNYSCSRHSRVKARLRWIVLHLDYIRVWTLKRKTNYFSFNYCNCTIILMNLHHLRLNSTAQLAPCMHTDSHNIPNSFVQRYTHGQHTHAHTHATHAHTHILTLHISSHSLHSAEKRLKCHKCSCSHRGHWQLSKLLLLPSLLPVPYHSHSLHISFTLLTLSFLLPLSPPVFLFFCSLSSSSLALWSVFFPCPVSAQCTSIIQRQSTGFSGLSNQSRALH